MILGYLTLICVLLLERNKLFSQLKVGFTFSLIRGITKTKPKKGFLATLFQKHQFAWNILTENSMPRPGHDNVRNRATGGCSQLQCLAVREGGKRKEEGEKRKEEGKIGKKKKKKKRKKEEEEKEKEEEEK